MKALLLVGHSRLRKRTQAGAAPLLLLCGLYHPYKREPLLIKDQTYATQLLLLLLLLFNTAVSCSMSVEVFCCFLLLRERFLPQLVEISCCNLTAWVVYKVQYVGLVKC